MTDNTNAYRISNAWREGMADIGTQPRFTRPYRPTAKAERFNRGQAEERT